MFGLCFVTQYKRESRKFCQSGSNFDNVFFFSFMRGGKIKIPLLAGRHRPASETPYNGVSLACRWWSHVECWLGRTPCPPPTPLDPHMQYLMSYVILNSSSSGREGWEIYVNCLLAVTISVLCLFLTVSWVGAKCVIVAFLGHTYLLFTLLSSRWGCESVHCVPVAMWLLVFCASSSRCRRLECSL